MNKLSSNVMPRLFLAGLLATLVLAGTGCEVPTAVEPETDREAQVERPDKPPEDSSEPVVIRFEWTYDEIIKDYENGHTAFLPIPLDEITEEVYEYGSVQVEYKQDEDGAYFPLPITETVDDGIMLHTTYAYAYDTGDYPDTGILKIIFRTDRDGRFFGRAGVAKITIREGTQSEPASQADGGFVMAHKQNAEDG